MRKLRQEAARQGRTMSDMAEMALRLMLASAEKRESIAPLPQFRSGVRWWTLPIAMRFMTRWKAVSADTDSPFRAPYRNWLERVAAPHS